jgi:hypothetical protein
MPETSPTSQNSKLDQNRYRVILTKEEARAIFSVKNNHCFESPNQASIRLARAYHVSSKSVRDIWNGRSWLGATFDLWREEDRPVRRAIGRPKGRKDDKPRVHGRIPPDRNDSKNRLGPSMHNIISNIDHSLDRLPSMKNLVPLQQCRFTEQMHTAPDESSALFLQPHKQDVWSMASSSDRTACVLPGFRSLMQGMGFDPTLSHPFGQHSLTSPAANPHLSIHFRTLSEPPMFGGTDGQDSLLAILSSHLLSAHNTLSVSAAPVGFSTESMSLT